MSIDGWACSVYRLLHILQRIVAIADPPGRIVMDVGLDPMQFPLTTDDVLEIIALPQATGESWPTHMFDPIGITSGCQRFEAMNHID